MHPQAKIEFALLKSVHSAVERLYQDGKPLHHLRSAEEIEYHPDVSQFFITTQAALESLTAMEVQRLFRHRHILVSGSPTRDFNFDRRGLAKLGSLTAPRCIQGELIHSLGAGAH
jgi:hypothetical protein